MFVLDVDAAACGRLRVVDGDTGPGCDLERTTSSSCAGSLLSLLFRAPGHHDHALGHFHELPPDGARAVHGRASDGADPACGSVGGC
jgi:hypothetical protein